MHANKHEFAGGFPRMDYETLADNADVRSAIRFATALAYQSSVRFRQLLHLQRLPLSHCGSKRFVIYLFA
jgi:hypothetical protein